MALPSLSPVSSSIHASSASAGRPDFQKPLFRSMPKEETETNSKLAEQMHIILKQIYKDKLSFTSPLQATMSPLGTTYKIRNILGSGTYSTVFKVSNAVGKCFAAKISSSFPQDQVNEEKIVSMCKQYADKESIQVPIIDMIEGFWIHFPYTDPQTQKSITVSARCTIYELLGHSLEECLKTPQQFNVIRQIALQVLRALECLSNEKIIHCDLKPENILMKESNQIKVCDFGIASNKDLLPWKLVQTGPYRAPEVTLEIHPYTPAIDMWSLGLILLQAFFGRHPFPMANSNKEVLNGITSVIGNYSLQQRFPLEKMEPIPNNLHKLLGRPKKGTEHFLFFQLIESMLQWDPQKRITPQEALNHPFFLFQQKEVQIEKPIGLAQAERQSPSTAIPLAVASKDDQCCLLM